jgi:hypothetical protein
MIHGPTPLLVNLLWKIKALKGLNTLPDVLARIFCNGIVPNDRNNGITDFVTLVADFVGFRSDLDFDAARRRAARLLDVLDRQFPLVSLEFGAFVGYRTFSDEFASHAGSLPSTLLVFPFLVRLPSFVESCRKNEEMVIIHQDSFAADYQQDEYTLLGMAIKFAGLHGKESQSASACRSQVKLLNMRTDSSSRSGGTAT